jgi:hypothetical protein
MHDTPAIRIPAQRKHEPRHQMWCSNHSPGATAGDFGTCQGDTLNVGDAWVGIADAPALDGGVRIDFGGGNILDGTTVDDAERFALAILCQVACARGADLPPSALAMVTA